MGDFSKKNGYKMKWGGISHFPKIIHTGVLNLMMSPVTPKIPPPYLGKLSNNNG